MNIATINSTLSSWFVFQAPETGTYNYTIHNIDIGCFICCEETKSASSYAETTHIANEDNISKTFGSMKKGDYAYLEIYPFDTNSAEANGECIIEIEKIK